jgi:predicted component of type VI protein secretion system
MASQTFHLLMRAGPNPGKVYELVKNELVIGRDINADIVINDSEVSRKHARLTMQGAGVVLEDLGSTNGTFVDGQRLMGPHILRLGEVVMLGENVTLVFEAAFDADATMVSSSAVGPVPAYPAAGPYEGGKPTYQAPPPPAYQAPAYQPQQAPAPAYTGQVPPGPAEEYPEYGEPATEPKKNNRRMLLIGCGCLVVLCVVVVGGGFLFDYLNLYCKVPLISSFFACP